MDVLGLVDKMRRSNIVDIYIEQLISHNERQLPEALLQPIPIDDDDANDRIEKAYPRSSTHTLSDFDKGGERSGVEAKGDQVGNNAATIDGASVVALEDVGEGVENVNEDATVEAIRDVGVGVENVNEGATIEIEISETC